MYKTLDLSELGGYPLTQEDLDWMQTSYRLAFASVSQVIGDKVILWGLENVAGVASPGWISLGGEMVPCAGGAIGTGEFIIDNLSYPRTFNDGNTYNVRVERIMKFSAGGPYNYNDLKRIGRLKDSLVPAGAIMMWSGAIANIPYGWALCDGTNGTPNLKGKFIVGYDTADVDYDVIGNVGGEKAHKLTSLEQGALKIAAKVDDIGGGTTTAVAKIRFNGTEVPMNGGANQSSYGTEITVQAAIADNAHENRPPYYTLAYIMKLP